MEVKNDYAQVTTQRILNKFIEINGMYSLAVMLSISSLDYQLKYRKVASTNARY